VANPANRQELNEYLRRSPQDIRLYFGELSGILERFSLDVALAYVFARTELAHNMALYCGIVKIHHAHSGMARTAIDATHLTRELFPEKFESVFGRPLPNEVVTHLRGAEGTRDRVMHGKSTPDSAKREAIAHVIDYACRFNDVVYPIAGFRPFGNLRGFHGRGKSLPKNSTRWILKGMGFKLS